MSFQITKEHVTSILGPAGDGDWAPFLEALDPEVHWIIADPERHTDYSGGTFNVKSWFEEVNKPLRACLATGINMKIVSIDVFGQKAIVEAAGNAMQKNGKPYNNLYCWILIFGEGDKAGKVVKIREYLNTALVKEVLEGNQG